MKQVGKLTVALRGDREILLSRVFDAPRELVFEALTTPRLLLQWFHGPPGWTLTECEFANRVGGAYRYVWTGTGGVKMGLGGIHREFVPPERIVSTERFDESWYPGEAIVTTVLTEQGGKTTLTATVQYQSKAARDEVLKSPMEQGVAICYDQLESFLASKSPH